MLFPNAMQDGLNEGWPVKSISGSNITNNLSTIIFKVHDFYTTSKNKIKTKVAVIEKQIPSF